MNASSGSNKTRIVTIAVIVILSLLAVNGYLLINKYNQDSVIEKQEEDLAYADSLGTELTRQYAEAVVMLDSKKSENEELNTIIEQNKNDLKEMTMKIERALKRSGTNRAELKKANAMINDLIVQKEGYLAEIDKLFKEKGILQNEIDKVEIEKAVASKEKELLMGISMEEKENIDKIKKDKEDIKKDKEMLQDKALIASLLKPANITVNAQKMTNSGAFKNTRYAKRAKALEVCFQVPVNKVTNTGANKFILRVINPLGETIAIESQGSGSFANQDDGGTRTRYTFSETIDYDNKAQDICSKWVQDNTLESKGVYTVEVFNKGYLVGTGSVKLK